MSSILDPEKFSVAPGDMRSMQDRMLELRKGLPQDVQQRLGQMPGMPQQTQVEQRQDMDFSDMLQNTMRGMAEKKAAGDAQVQGKIDVKTGQPKVNPKTTEDYLAQLNQIWDDGTSAFKKPMLHGPDLGEFLGSAGAGGILGTGITPLDVLAFAFGVGTTWNLPQEAAQRNTFFMAGLPRKMREGQQQSVKDMMQAVQGMANVENTGVQNQINLAKLKQQQDQQAALKQFAEFERGQGRERNALAILAEGAGRLDLDPTSNYLGLTAGDEREITNVIAGNAKPSERLVSFGITDADKATQYMATKAMGKPIASADGRVYVAVPGRGIMEMGQGGMRIHPFPQFGPQQAAPQQPQQPAPQAAPQQAPSFAPGAPQAPTQNTPSGHLPDQPKIVLPGFGGQAGTTPAQQAPVGAPGVVPGTGQEAYTAPVGQRLPNQQSWEASVPAELASSGAVIKPLFARPMDATARDKMIAGYVTTEFAKQLGSAWTAVMAENPKGDPGFMRQLKYLATSGDLATGGGDSPLGVIVGTGGRLFSAAAQRLGRPLTDAEQNLMALYAGAQSYARGAMNDAANLATSERAIFKQMIGSVMDMPELALRKLEDLYKKSALQYNTTWQHENQMKNMGGLQPLAPRIQFDRPAGAAPKQAPSRAIQTPGGKLPPGALVVPQQNEVY